MNAKIPLVTLVHVDEVLDTVQVLTRTAWKPVTMNGEGGPEASKFGGAPAVVAGESWPACGGCGEPMQLFVQLRSSELPAPPPFTGLLQLFYCTSCDAWAPHSPGVSVRVLPEGTRLQPAAASPVAGTYPARRIVSWKAVEDHPHWDELGRAGVPEHLREEVSEGYSPVEGDKYLGWPAWTHRVAYPSCRVCGTEMALLFQLASDDHLPYMFGDAGTGHVTICPDHPGELAFGWTCL
jgi:hypothetical protein